MKQLATITLRNLRSALLALCLIVVAACFTACTFHEDVDASLCTDQGKAYMKVKFSFTIETRAASNPQGGEEGDGRENGVNHENEIKNVMLFVIPSTANLDSDGSTEFLYKRYFDDTYSKWTTLGTETTITFAVEDYYPHNGDRIIAVANAGPHLDEITTLGALRDFTNYAAWQNGLTIKDYYYFVMSSAYNSDTEGKIIISSEHDGTEAKPYFSSLTVQRAAARIDFMYKESTNYTGTAPTTELTYDVMPSVGSEKVGTVHLENIIPINLMQQPSYMIKRMASSFDTPFTVNYGAKETIDAYGFPTNYVVEPHTLSKQTSVDETTLNTWYGSTRAKTIKDGITGGTFSYAGTSISDYVSTHTAHSELSYFTHAMTLAYTNENTQSKEKQLPDFMTGLLLKTTYEPKTVYSDASLTVATYTKGTTFWRYSPTKTLMKEEDCKYFTNEVAATAYKSAHPDDFAEITLYINGVCYYNLWIRHANVDSDPHTTFPMEYGIVRNNIYRIGVEKFTGPGSPTATLNGPDHLYLRIFVRKWNLRTQPTIRL